MDEDFEKQDPGSQDEDQRTFIGKNGNVLIPFKKGQSGNPNGLEKGTKHLLTIMKALLNEEIVASINGKPFKITRGQALMLEKVRLATSSDFDHVRLAAIKDIEDRLEGKPVGVLPAPPDAGEGGVVFYIPNQHSRRKSRKQN